MGKPSQSHLRFPLALLVGLAAGISVGAAPGNDSSLYVRTDSWAETVATAWTRLIRRQNAVKQLPAGRGPGRFVSERLAGDGPGQSVSVAVAGRQWLRLVTVLEEGSGNCHVWGEATLTAADGTKTRLSSLEPAAVSVGWGELLYDLNWQQRPLRVGSRTFEHGLWVHANSNVVYALDGKYDRFEAWVGADADRPSGTSRFAVFFDAFDPTADVWPRLSADFPRQSAWLTRDVEGDGELVWLGEAPGVGALDRMVGKALNRLGAGAGPFRQRFGELRRSGMARGDPRWLDFYARVCRFGDCSKGLERIWVQELRAAFGTRLAGLLDPTVSPDDPRWAELGMAIRRCAAVMPAGHSADMDAMRAVSATLEAALPGRFEISEELSEKLDECHRRWQSLRPGVLRGDDATTGPLSALGRDARALRESVLRSLKGMTTFLGQPGNVSFLDECQRQFKVLEADLGNRPHFARVASEAFHPQALIREGDRDPLDVVLRRTVALLGDLRPTFPGVFPEPLAADLAALCAAAAAVPVEHVEARRLLYVDACRVRRLIALTNPVLDFDELLFIKRHRSGFNHMCDQYYGTNARPGGGVFVLSGPFGAEPVVRDLLADVRVSGGRLAGEALEGGSFLSPDLSYDAKTLLFAYAECTGPTGHREHMDHSRGHWSEGRCYHVFRASVDGSDLVQLTDGTFNDFDPCWLPNGRVAFISERRGGYLRCGRRCPTYTLFDMQDDGSDVRCLSFHETNEWHPSVMHDGMIVWTRWDYVDRHGCTAHTPWVISPDGRDPRSIHGNFSLRYSRPDMELDIRAVPGSHRLIATAAPHHGQAYGSLVMIDPRVPDDDAMAPVRRVTPDVSFPESQGGREVYGEAWPLSEKYYLCAYDPATQASGLGAPGHYGIYLVDCFGNKELLYRDASIGSHNPIPLRPRPSPPTVPDRSVRVPADEPAEATVGVANVYDTRVPLPQGTTVAALRIYQILPLSVASAAVPHNTGIQIPQGSDSVNLARRILGTVPVEADGSAFFTVPARKELYFQALDADGLAVQSMRSAAQFQPGERSMCQGCHSRRHGTPSPPGTFVAAMSRPPSRIVPEVDGSNPFSYPRLVQPVLESKCVGCHVENATKGAPRLDAEPVRHRGRGGMDRTTTYYASYVSLTPGYGFYDYGGKGWSDPKWYRTTAGEFGARGSKLYGLLGAGHHGVALSPEQMHRLTLWLDSCSLFYGVYEKEGGEAQLRGEVPMPTLE